MSLHLFDRRGLVSSTCPLPKSYIDEPNLEKPLFGKTTFQDLMVYISLAFTIITIVLNATLAGAHLMNYTRPSQQRQIVRIIFYPVIFAICSTASVFSYPDSIYLSPAQEIYEPIALVAIFFLFLDFAAPDPATRESYFNDLENWKPTGGRISALISRLRGVKKPKYEIVPGGSYRWYLSKWVAIYIYFFATIIIHIVEEITQYLGRYCSSSWSPTFAHVWVFVISKIVLPVGVIAVIQFYYRLKDDPEFVRQNSKQKIISFKALIALNFLQEIIFSVLTAEGVLGRPDNKPQSEGLDKVTYKDLSIGLPALLTAIEQAAVAVWFWYSYSPAVYREQKKAGEKAMPLWRAVLNSLNPMDLVLGLPYAIKLLMSGVGPRGNGSWTQNGGYKNVSSKSSASSPPQQPAYGPQSAYGAPPAKYDNIQMNAYTGYGAPPLQMPIQEPRYGQYLRTDDEERGELLAPPSEVHPNEGAYDEGRYQYPDTHHRTALQ